MQTVGRERVEGARKRKREGGREGVNYSVHVLFLF